jgi:YVTN family beta-propeller protein
MVIPIVWDSINNKIYCGNGDSCVVLVIDGTTDAVVTTIVVGQWPWGLVWNSLQNRIYTANTMSSNISVIKDVVGIKENNSTAIASNKIGATILSGSLQLPKDKKCKVYDITGRIVIPENIKLGIYFIEIDGVITQKVVKVR